MNCCSVLWFIWFTSNHICALALSLAPTATSLYLRLFKKHLRAQIYINFYSWLFYKNSFDAHFWLFLIFYILKLKLHHFPLPPSNFLYLASLNLLSLSLSPTYHLSSSHTVSWTHSLSFLIVGIWFQVLQFCIVYSLEKTNFPTLNICLLHGVLCLCLRSCKILHLFLFSFQLSFGHSSRVPFRNYHTNLSHCFWNNICSHAYVFTKSQISYLIFHIVILFALWLLLFIFTVVHSALKTLRDVCF